MDCGQGTATNQGECRLGLKAGPAYHDFGRNCPTHNHQYGLILNLSIGTERTARKLFRPMQQAKPQECPPPNASRNRLLGCRAAQTFIRVSS
ncbi:hypothetical protein BN77_1951 [Rhizobium mesoamericanum STM3625]|uniref:Uncharacterized protein n=1 Tax=Rhizobium mesoamericanum STM3625 TaxID=1211777 RepID=K0PE01_9HYPH|nr:hypothetical protein BN77_1951 [Rhizobium mesoamericanum STM3625]